MDIVAPGLVDEYPLKPKDPAMTITPKDVKRLLGIDLTAKQIADLLERLEFKCTVEKSIVKAKVPPHRMDIGTGVVGLADVLEEVARVYGYDRIPSTIMADRLPPQVGNPIHEWEERLRDLLITLGFDEVVSYRLTSIEREARLGVTGDYVHIANPIAPERSVLRRSLAASVLDAMEHNIRLSESLAFFEIGPIFEPNKNDLPDEPRKLAIAMTGLREATAWDVKDSTAFDFYDMKGRIELLLSGLHYTNISYSATDSIKQLHPGKTAEIKVNDQIVGAFGELHPLVKEKYELGDLPVLVAELDLEILRVLNPTYGITPVPEFPPVLEDIAVIVDELVDRVAYRSIDSPNGRKERDECPFVRSLSRRSNWSRKKITGL